MRAFLAASTALFLVAAPAHAQILGSVGGGQGGGLGGTLGGTIGSPIGDPMSSIGSATRGTLDGAGSASANK